MSVLSFLFTVLAHATQPGLSLSGEEVSLVFPQSHSFVIWASEETASISLGHCLSYIASENIYLSTASVEGSKALEIDDYVSFDGIRQWKLVFYEDFEEPAGWSDNRNSKCAGITMLGGYCVFSDQVVSKTFTGLPQHSAVKIVANFHFIDAWIGETGYLKVSLNGKSQFVWTESYKAGQAGQGVNLCGGHHDEGKFFSGIEVIVPHSDSSIELSFGATVGDDPCDESWGVSGLQIFTR